MLCSFLFFVYWSFCLFLCCILWNTNKCLPFSCVLTKGLHLEMVALGDLQYLLLIQPQWTCIVKPNLFVSLKTWPMQHFSSLERNILFHTLSQMLLRVLRVLAICRNWPQVRWVCNNYAVSVLPNWVSWLLLIWSFFRSRISLAKSISQQNWNISFVLRVGFTKLN